MRLRWRSGSTTGLLRLSNFTYASTKVRSTSEPSTSRTRSPTSSFQSSQPAPRSSTAARLTISSTSGPRASLRSKRELPARDPALSDAPLAKRAMELRMILKSWQRIGASCEHPGHRYRWDERQDACNRSGCPTKVPIGSRADTGTDGCRRNGSDQGLEFRGNLNRLPRPRVVWPTHDRTCEPGSGMDGI